MCLAGVTRHPDQKWMEQITRNVTREDNGILVNCRYLLHDRDRLIEAENVKTVACRRRAQSLNAFAER